MEAWGTTPLTRYFLTRLPSNKTFHWELYKKSWQKTKPKIPEDLCLWRTLAYQILPKALNRLSATAWVPQDILKALAILLVTTFQRSIVDQEDMKPYYKSEERPYFSKMIYKYIIYKVFKNFLTLTGQ